jgi:hypothetical protein
VLDVSRVIAPAPALKMSIALLLSLGVSSNLVWTIVYIVVDVVVVLLAIHNDFI